MRHLIVERWLAIIGTVCVLSVDAGYLLGGCRQQCFEVSCLKRAAPLDDQLCDLHLVEDQPINLCFMSHNLWHRDFSIGTCTTQTGAYEWATCLNCNPECANPGSVEAYECGEVCTIQLTYNQIYKCDTE